MFGALGLLFFEIETSYFSLFFVLGDNASELFVFCVLQSDFIIFFSFCYTPAKQRVILKGFNYNQNRLFIHSQYLHYFLTCVFKDTISPARIHSIY